MKLSAMTLGCPAWDLPTVLDRLRAYGFDGVDFRGLQSALDITTLPAFTTGLAATARQIRDAGLEVSAVSSSLTVCDPDARQKNLEEARRTIPVALGLGARYVRIFGGGPKNSTDLPQAAAIGRACIADILALDGATQLTWMFETHDLWMKARDCRLLLDAIPNPAFAALWDLGHTYRVGGETPEETWAEIGPRVVYTHVKDAVPDPATGSEGWRFVHPGTGTLPLETSVRLLRRHGYDGWLTFEHEKRWHPELPEPEEAFPAFMAWARRVLQR